MDNILIVGRGASASAFAKKLKTCDNVGEIYIATGNTVQTDCFTNIDIREDDVTELLKFALENNVKLTVALSVGAIKADIAGFFNENGQSIFAPYYSACKDFFNRTNEKKFLYKIHANPPRFASFSKPQDIKNYLENAQYPIIISSSEYTEIKGYSQVCSTIYAAQCFLNNLYNKGVTDILIEDFVYGKDFTVYYITDGYTVLPINSSCHEEFDKNGYLHSHKRCFVPNYYISENIYYKLQNIADEIISYFANKQTPYIGILGLCGTLADENKFVVRNIKTSFDDIDANAMLNSIDDDVYKILSSCVNGFFSDEYSKINTNDLNFASIELDNASAAAKKDDCADFINKDKFILTKSASTLSRAKKYLEEEIAITKA